jgi:hypothetical protein
VITTIRDARLDPWTQPLHLPAADGGYVLIYRRDKRKEWNPALYRLTPADQFDVKGTYVSKRSIKEGVGAPLVAVGLDKNLDARKCAGSGWRLECLAASYLRRRAGVRIEVLAPEDQQHGMVAPRIDSPASTHVLALTDS